MSSEGKNLFKNDFTNLLIEWNREENKRQMPWKGEKDPYKIWLSEIILQQTRVEQGLNYYRKFIKIFPNIHKLAKAPDEKVFKLWEGLGYYTRCKNLIETAHYISRQENGKFPETYNKIKALKGIGSYTAAAIASFAFNLPYAVVDGNVHRVLSRVFGINKPIYSTEGKKFFTSLANELLDKKNPGLYNQAIMDFGASVCKPASPLCRKCIFRKNCIAFLNDRVSEFPAKSKKLIIKKRWFYYLFIEYKDQIIIRQRTEKDIWRHLFEFPLIETEKRQKRNDILQKAFKKRILKKNDYSVVSESPLLKQKLSHQLILGQFFKIKLKQKIPLLNGWHWTPKNELRKYAFPGFINKYLQEEPV